MMISRAMPGARLRESRCAASIYVFAKMLFASSSHFQATSLMLAHLDTARAEIARATLIVVSNHRHRRHTSTTARIGRLSMICGIFRRHLASDVKRLRRLRARFAAAIY